MIFSSDPYQKAIKSILIPFFAISILGGCSEKETYDFPPACPKISVLPATGDYYSFTSSSQELFALDLKASILGIKGKCLDDPKNIDNLKKKQQDKPYVDHIDTNLQIIIQAQRGPSSTSRNYQIPYFVATIKNGEIVDKKDLTATITFPNNIDQISITSGQLLFKIPSTPARTPDGYELAIGFQLSPKQLSYNRSHFNNIQYKTY